MKILVAYDGSPAADTAVSEVLRRPWPEGTRVRLVRAVEQPILVAPPHGLTISPLVERVHTVLHEEAHAQTLRAVGRFSARPELEVSYELRQGPAKTVLLDAIREWKADLVLAGSHGGSALARFLLGSVCHALVTHAPCSVEVVRAAEAA
jgi:nucleotide-binding universal stress UspA family protein